MSNDQNSYEEDHNKFLFEQISRAKFEFEYIVDAIQSIAKTFDAQCTPEFYYFSNDKKLKYRGRLDSNGKDPLWANQSFILLLKKLLLKDIVQANNIQV